MFLSPTAQPFQPALEFAIFNDGVPCSVFYGCHPEHDVIHHIPDEAIDELFPPTAEEAAEMDAAEDFVETMAWLAFLDECEEEARTTFAGYKKRWSTRRVEGLVGRPHPPKTTTKDHDSHDRESSPGSSLAGSANGETIMMVPYVKTNFEIRPRKVESRMLYGVGGAGRSCVSKNAKLGGLHGHRGLIQQPRKH